MPCKRAEKARKTRKVTSKECRDLSTEIVTRNLRSVGLKDRVHIISKACDAAEVPDIQHEENQDIDPALSPLEIDKKCLPSSVALQMHNEDNETASVILSGNFKPALNYTDLAGNSSNDKLVMECSQTLEDDGTLFQNEYFEEGNADVSYNLMRNGDESNTIEYMNTDVSHNITRKRQECKTNEAMNVGVSQDDNNIIEDMNADASYSTREQEERNTIEDIDEKLNADFYNRSDSCLKLHQDNVCEVSELNELASSETTMLISITANGNGANTVTANKVIHNVVDNCIDRDLPAITAVVTVNRLKSFSQSVVLQSKCDKPVAQESTTESIEDITSGFLSQIKQSSLDALGNYLGTDATQASPKSKLLKRKAYKHLFSSQPPSKRFKPPSTMTISDHCYNTTDSAPYKNTEVVTQTDSFIVDESICDSVVVVNPEPAYRNMNSKDMLPYSTAVSHDNSCAGYTMEKGENGSAVTQDEGNKMIEEEDNLAITQCWYPDCAKVNEEITLSNLQDQNRVNEELSLSELPGRAKVDKELSLSELPDRAKVNVELSLSELPDHAKVDEELSLSELPDRAKVDEEISLSELPDHAKVDEELSLSELPDRAKVDEELSLSELPDRAKVDEELSLSELPDRAKVDKELSLSELPDRAKVNEELSLSELPDRAKVDEELSVSELPDRAKVDELILPEYPDHAEVQEKLSTVTKSEVYEQEQAVWMNDSMKDNASTSEIKSGMQQNLSEAADNEDDQMLTSSPLQILPGVKFDDLHKDKAENITDLSKLNTSYTINMGHNKKLNQNSVGSNGEEFTVETSDSELALTCIENSRVTDSTRCTTAVLDHPIEASELTGTSVNEHFNDITACFSNSVLKHQGKEKLTTFTTIQECVMNTSDCTINKFHGNLMENVQNNEKEDLVCMGTQEFTINDFVINDFISKEGIENIQLTQSSVTTNLTKEGKLSKEESMNKATVSFNCKIDPPLSPSCEKMKEGNSCKTFCPNQICYRSGLFKKEDTFNCNICTDVNKLTHSDKEDTYNSNRCADVNKLTDSDKEDTYNSNRCADVNKLTHSDKEDTFNSNRCATDSDTVKTHGDMLHLKAPEMYAQGISNQIQGMSSNSNVEGRVTVNSSLHTEAMTAHSLQDVVGSTKCHQLPPHAQTVCDKYQHRPQLDNRLDQDNTYPESDSLITENLTNQICTKQPPVLIKMNDSIKECSTPSKSISAPLSSPHNRDAREIQLNRNSGCIQKCSFKLPVTNKDTKNTTTEGSQLGNSDCFEGVLKCAGVFACMPLNITGADSSIAKQNEVALDNTDCHTNMRFENASSDTKVKLLLTSSKTDLFVERGMSGQKTSCFPNKSEKYLGNCQDVFDNLDCYSLSDSPETTGKPSKPVFNNHTEESKITVAAQSFSDHKGTSRQPSNCPGSVSQGIFCKPQKNPQSNYEDTTTAFLNKSVSGINEMHRTLQKLSTMDSATYLSDSQICQLASEDFEQAFNSNETEDIDNVEDVHLDKFEQSFSSAQARSVREIEQRSAEGKKLVDGVIVDLVSVNKQLLRMKREMETVKRVVQQQNNKPRQSFHGKHEFGFRYQN